MTTIKIKQAARRSLGSHAKALLLLTLAALSGAVFAGPFDALFNPTPPMNLSAVAPLQPLTEYRSENGRLDVDFEAQQTAVRVGDYTIQGATYNGLYGGPLLRVKPGDVLHVRLTNHLQQATNVHFHGLEVSPLDHGDNSMHLVLPGETWDYEIPIPATHPPGVYWYHTHGHQYAERQLMGGLSGTLVIEGFQDEVPATKPLTEQILVIKDFTPDKSGNLQAVPKPFNFTMRTINGQLQPRLDMQPGETQLWRFTNQTANGYLRLALEGHQITVIGRDSHPILRPQSVDEVFIGPAERLDVLVTAKSAGSFRLVAEETTTGPAGDTFPAQDLALVTAAPNAALPPPAPLGPLTIAASKTSTPIRGDVINAERSITFSSDPVTGLFFINHAAFDHTRVDVLVPLGSIEEWTLRNAADELHTFHIHQITFQVLSVNGKDVPFEGRVDTVDIPIHGEVKIRLDFTDPIIVGRFMFHCHILEHEDKGMMQQIEVYDPRVGPMPESAMDMNGMDHTLHMPALATGE